MNYGVSFAGAKRVGEPLQEPEGDSTLVRRGTQAATFREMVEFADLLENRPLSTLLGELPGIAALSNTKFHLATQILRRRFRKESETDKEQLVVIANEVADGVSDDDLRYRIREIFAEEP